MKFKKITISALVLLATCQSIPKTKAHTLFTERNTQEANVIYSPKVINSFLYIYDGQKREIPLCLEGKKVNEKYVVEGIRFPFIVESDSVSSQYMPESCDFENYIGMAHNHSNKNCSVSEVDYERFKHDTRARVESIVCGADLERNEVTIGTLNKDLLNGN